MQGRAVVYRNAQVKSNPWREWTQHPVEWSSHTRCLARAPISPLTLGLAGAGVIGRPDHRLQQYLAHDIQVLFGDPLVHHRMVALLLRRRFVSHRKGKFNLCLNFVFLSDSSDELIFELLPWSICHTGEGVWSSLSRPGPASPVRYEPSQRNEP